MLLFVQNGEKSPFLRYFQNDMNTISVILLKHIIPKNTISIVMRPRFMVENMLDFHKDLKS